MLVVLFIKCFRTPVTIGPITVSQSPVTVGHTCIVNLMQSIPASQNTPLQVLNVPQNLHFAW